MPDGLAELVEDAAAGLSAVARRTMFGCPSWFAAGHIFALVYQGRIGVRLPEPAQFEALLATPGAERWRVSGGRISMSCWVLVPEGLHDDPLELRRWVGRAHAAALAVPPKPARRRRPAAARRRRTAQSRR